MNNQIIKTQYPSHVEHTLNGKLHRTNGPARIWDNGTKSWFINGSLHREHGPAVILSNGTKYWFINGKQLSENEFNQYILKHNLEKI